MATSTLRQAHGGLRLTVNSLTLSLSLLLDETTLDLSLAVSLSLLSPSLFILSLSTRPHPPPLIYGPPPH